jgi:thiol-disulfide isomerase/thioredoxin
MAAMRIQDPAARLSELKRIKSAYPKSQMKSFMDMLILYTQIDMAPTLDAVVRLQRQALAEAKGPRLFQSYLQFASQIVNHPKVDAFDKNKIVETLLDYQDEVKKLSENPDIFKGLSEDQQEAVKTYFVTGLGIPIARAYFLAGDPANTLSVFETFKKEGGVANIFYHYYLGEAYNALNRKEEAYEAYLNAAVESGQGDLDKTAADKARALYIELKGNASGFETELNARFKKVPFHVTQFKPSASWKGKTVLAELFTGSECPPCVGTDLGFDGLIESYAPEHLVILQYHLPIPRPDPMMNPATKLRQDFYQVNSTPTVFIDGTQKIVGGGGRGMAESKYYEYKKVIDPMLNSRPGVRLKIEASSKNDTVLVSYDFDQKASGAEYIIVLVQDEEEYEGLNGLKYHKMVVRDLAVIDPTTARKITFDLKASEKNTDIYLTDFEKTYTRNPNFKWRVRHNIISREGLKVAFFVQDRESKKVLNAAICSVK